MTLTKVGPATVTVAGPQAPGTGASLNVQAGTANLNTDAGADANTAHKLSVTVGGAGSTVNFGATQHLAALTADANGLARLTGGGSKVLATNALTIAGSTGAWTGKVDLTDNDMVIRNGAAGFATTYDQVKTGYNGGAWDGLGISSSAANDGVTALAAIVNDDGYGSQIFSPTFDGIAVDSNSVIVKFTWYGDANLDGVVDDTTDYDLWSTGLAGFGTGWYYGDFDYSGTIDDTTDYDLWSTGLAFQTGPLSGAGGQPIPEPMTLGVLALGGLALLRRRR
jgi:hypothetical protein